MTPPTQFRYSFALLFVTEHVSILFTMRKFVTGSAGS